MRSDNYVKLCYSITLYNKEKYDREFYNTLKAMKYGPLNNYLTSKRNELSKHTFPFISKALQSLFEKQ